MAGKSPKAERSAARSADEADVTATKQRSNRSNETDQPSGAGPSDAGETAERDRDLLGLGAFIRSQRRLAELSQRELAKLTQLSDPYVSQLERGLHEPSMRVLRNLATALNLPMETLIRQAGWFEDEDTKDKPDTENAIRNDPALSGTPKTALLEVYRAFVSATDQKD